MNRVTAVLLAAGALLVHMLALYRDAAGAFGMPYESAHAAFRLGRNLAHEGVLAWNTATGAGGLDSYPSPLWIAVAWLAEQLWWPVTKFAQLIGILCTLGTVAISTRFDTDRIAGVVPALLLVSCAALAITGPSGTEWSLVTFLLVTAFVAQEHGRVGATAVASAALVAARPEGALAVLVLAAQCLTSRRPRRVVAHVPAVAVLVALELLGARTAALLGDALSPTSARAAEGLAALSDFVRTTVSPLLVVFPLVALAWGELSAIGRRALALGLAWVALVVLEGGGPWALQLAFVPALPLVFIAVEQGIARALDTYVPAMERLSWAAIGVAMAGSVLASRFPGDLGPLGLDSLYARWLAPSATPPQGHPPALARTSLHHEILLTREARRIGLFARDHLPKDATILTPWPGAIGYLARLDVLDLHGRTTGLGGDPPAPWWPTRRNARLLAALATRPDYILPGLAPRGPGDDGTPTVVAREFVALEDLQDPEFGRAVRQALLEYEFVACAPSNDFGDRRPVFLLRRIDPASSPTLALTRAPGGPRAVVVEVAPPSKGPPLLARLELALEDADGTRTYVTPDGASTSREPRSARGTFELRAGGSAPLALGTFVLPGSVVTAHAQLWLPSTSGPHPLPLGPPVTLSLR